MMKHGHTIQVTIRLSLNPICQAIATRPMSNASRFSGIETALAADGIVVSTLRAAFPHALAIHVFGSQAQGMVDVASDLDLAILTAGYADPLALWDTANQLAEMIGCEVDLLDLRAASTVMQYQVLMGGRRLWAHEPDASLFECFVLSEKAALDAARAGLLADIVRDGQIQGG